MLVTSSRIGTVGYDRLKNVDDAISSFEAEMKEEGIWDDVVLVSSSDFGRKLVGNGAGTGTHAFFLTSKR